ncbi:MAG TPA: YihY/virulence factor BrkB family protein [Blastocatellia bacterium]|nr:YihY/virulence factor BrkB family protein [Blastocatellia bacterium]
MKTWREATEDNLFGTAAELSYYFLLALFPLLIFLTSVIGFLPGAAHGNLIRSLERVAPPDVMKLVRDWLADIVSHRSGGLLSVGLIGSLWAASSGVASLMDTLNTAYDATETRPFWKRRLIAIGLTLALAMLVAGGSLLIMFGHLLGSWLGAALNAGPMFAAVSSAIGYVVGFALLMGGIVLVYRFGPDLKRRKERVWPGALFASIGIVIGSLLFSLYLRVASVSATYGSLGAVVTLMLWLYLVGVVLLFGGELNSEMRSDS